MSKKMITIPFNGPIFPKASVQGPIETPYAEEVSTIGTLLSQAYPVTEHLENGATVVLTLNNFQKTHVEALVLEGENVEAIVVEEVTGKSAPTLESIQEQKKQEEASKQKQEEPQLSKKERKKLEQQRREEEQRKQEENVEVDGAL